MTDLEINEAVARKLGKITCQGKDGQWHLDHKPNGCGESVQYLIPNYSTDIRAAWEILDKCENEKRQIYVSSRNDAIRSGWSVGIDEILEWATTAPMAICKAFLKLHD